MKFQDLTFLIENTQNTGSEILLGFVRLHPSFSENTVPQFLQWVKSHYNMIEGTPDAILHDLAKDELDGILEDKQNEDDWTEYDEMTPEDFYQDTADHMYKMFLNDYITQGLKSFKHKRQQ